jgi:hypothetical protein
VAFEKEAGARSWPLDEYRAKAEECRLQAQRAALESEKEAWLKLAGDWLTLAGQAIPRQQRQQQQSLTPRKFDFN